ncbi:hypothetical protein [Pseudoroseicyclus sp. CXY001]|uniref:hypothetical protein n=1 Tax=Pseudoroseicyclus sp. CXY001 TaxID=3242492 RepID=UPI003570E60E
MRQDGLGSALAISLAAKFAAAPVAYLFLLLLARLLGAEGFGQVALVLSAAGFGALLAGAGQPTLVLRELSARGPAGAVWGRALALSALGALLGAAGLAVALRLGFGTRLTPGVPLAGGALLAALVGAELFSHALRAGGAPGLALLPRELAWRALAGLALCGAAAAGLHPTPAGVLWLMAGVLALLVGLQAAAGRRHLPRPVRGAPGRGGAAAFWGIAVASGLPQHLTLVAAGLSLPAEATGGLFAALRTAALLSLPLAAANLALAPRLARAGGHGAEVQAAIRLILPLAALPALLGLAGLALWGAPVLGLFDETYRAAAPALVILAAGFTLNSLTGPAGLVMTMGRGERAWLRLTLCAGAAGVIGAALAAPFGPAAAAAAIALAQTGQNLGAAAWVRRERGVETTVLALLRPRAAPAVAP